jgi:hypothetical protein
MKTVRFAGARWRYFAAATFALALPGIRAARAADAPAMLVATHDPALLSALDAAFSPRGVRVAMADRPLRATVDDLGAGAHGADLVWLCDVTPAPAGAAAPSGGAAPATALCVRPHQGTVIIRRIAVKTPLSPEDAAALALSVQVALMPDAAPPPAVTARPAPPSEPARSAGAAARAPTFTLELAGALGVGPAGHSSSLSLAAVYAPGLLDHHLGVGMAVAVGSTSPGGGVTSLDGRGSGPPQLGSVPGHGDRTLRLFARAQAARGPVWFQLDLGPAAHATNDVFGESSRWFWSLDGFAGAVVPFGRFFAGVRAGGEYAVIGRFATANAIDARWNIQALATAGLSWF